MTLTIRRAVADDAPEAGRVCYEGFRSIAEAHNYPPDIPSVEHGVGLVSSLIANPRFHGVVAVTDGRVVGSNFLDERGPIYGVGPISVDPAAQDGGVGRALMDAVMQQARAREAVGVRLVQAAYHRRSLALYAKLGYEIREPLACLQGAPIREEVPGCRVRAAVAADAPACNRVCFAVHGHARAGELDDAIADGAARVVERAGRVTGYATIVGFFGHAVGETNDDLKALIGAAEAFPGPGLLAPLRNGALMRWCLGKGLRIVMTTTLMSVGLYNEPAGAWLPSILY
jgi:GNAT superfamily N-acetyltransferase